MFAVTCVMAVAVVEGSPGWHVHGGPGPRLRPCSRRRRLQAATVKLAVTLTMPWPLPRRGSLPLWLALVLSPNQCRLSLSAGNTNRLSSECAKCLLTHTHVYPFCVAIKSAHFTRVFFLKMALPTTQAPIEYRPVPLSSAHSPACHGHHTLHRSYSPIAPFVSSRHRVRSRHDIAPRTNSPLADSNKLLAFLPRSTCWSGRIHWHKFRSNSSFMSIAKFYGGHRFRL